MSCQMCLMFVESLLCVLWTRLYDLLFPHFSVNPALLWGQRSRLHSLQRYSYQPQLVTFFRSISHYCYFQGLLNVRNCLITCSHLFPFSPRPSAHPNSNKNRTRVNHTARMTVEEGVPSNAAQSLRRQALQNLPLMSPRGPRPRSCHPTAAVA